MGGRRIAGIVLALAIALADRAAHADDPLPTRSGVTGGVGLGLSTEGLAGEAHLGYLLTDRFAVGLEVGGFAGASDIFGTSTTVRENVGSTVFSTIGVQYWLRSRIWVGAGAGPVRLGIYRTDPTGTHETGANWIPLGAAELGWEIRHTSRSSIDVKVELFMSYDQTHGVLNSIAVVAGFNLF
jgi:hypothetical protein